MVERHGGEVPCTEAELLALPGVGTYTAAAVATFAFGARTTVVDTNVRRVLARVLGAEQYAAASPTRAELTRAAGLVPADPLRARAWSVAVMELGALVCTARTPLCEGCPVADLCEWRVAGRPAYDGPPRRGQAWHGTDRQLRGALLAVLRANRGPVDVVDLEAVSDAAAQRDRCLDSLVADGLVEPLDGRRYRLPGAREAG
jgi:A/G-specific adenine glycosylase